MLFLSIYLDRQAYGSNVRIDHPDQHQVKNIEAPEFIKVTPKCNTIVAGSKTKVDVVVHTKGLDKINENIVITTDSEKTPTLTVNVLGNRK